MHPPGPRNREGQAHTPQQVESGIVAQSALSVTNNLTTDGALRIYGILPFSFSIVGEIYCEGRSKPTMRRNQ